MIADGAGVVSAFHRCRLDSLRCDAVQQQLRAVFRTPELSEYRSTTELAEALGVDRAYVSRTLRLTALAPGLVEQIVLGNEPEGVTLVGLVGDVPMVWADRNEEGRDAR